MPLFKRKLKKKNPTVKNIGEGLRVNKKKKMQEFRNFWCKKKIRAPGCTKY